MSLRQVLPKEHGTWAMLLVPWGIGCGAGGLLGAKELLLLVATLAAFLGNAQLAAWLRLRGGPTPEAAITARRLAFALAAVAAAAVAALVGVWHLTALVGFGALAALLGTAALLLVRWRRERGAAGQFLAPVGLSLTAVVANYVARGTVDAVAWALWGLSALFFLGAVFYVRLKIAAIPKKAKLGTSRAKLWFAAPTLAIDAALLVAAAAILRLASLPPVILVAFLPAAAQAIIGTMRLDRPARLKRVGILSTAHAICFALAVIALI